MRFDPVRIADAAGALVGRVRLLGHRNREAAVRFLVGGASNPLGANVEVKVIDPSANPYFATATILGLALDGIERKLTLPPETAVDPSTLTDEQRSGSVTLLPTSQAELPSTCSTDRR